MIEYLFDTPESLTMALSTALKNALSDQLNAAGMSSIAVSGGQTPKALFDQLSSVELDWGRITVTLTDERWVADDHPDSNERMVKQHLLKNRATPATFIPLKTAYKTAEGGQFALDVTLQEKLPVIDFVVLGMGGDGHFASLFPNTEALQNGLNTSGSLLCLATQSPVAPKERMSLTLSMILKAKKIYLLITGDDKLRVVRRACFINSADHLSLPISAVLNQTMVPVEMYWSPSSS